MALDKGSLKAPIIEIGKRSGYEVVENYDLGAGPIDVAWILKPGRPQGRKNTLQVLTFLRTRNS